MKRKKFHCMSSDITGKSKKILLLPSLWGMLCLSNVFIFNCDMQIRQPFTYEKKPKMREFSKSKNIFLTFLVFSRLFYRDSTIQKTFLYTILLMFGYNFAIFEKFQCSSHQKGAVLCTVEFTVYKIWHSRDTTLEYIDSSIPTYMSWWYLPYSILIDTSFLAQTYSFVITSGRNLKMRS